MKTGLFRRNVMKTVGTRAAKQGLKGVARNTARTNISHAVVNLKAHEGQLQQALGQYLTGERLTPDMLTAARVPYGDMAYDLTVLSRVLKTSLPSSTKKSKLSGTITAGLVRLSSLTTDLLVNTSVGLFSAPTTKKEKKMVVLPNKGGVKEEREVDVIDTDIEKQRETTRQEVQKAIVEQIVPLFWQICYAIFKEAPEKLIAEKFSRLKSENPTVEFFMGDKPKVKKAEVEQPTGATV